MVYNNALYNISERYVLPSLSENFPLLCLCFGNQFAAVAMAGGQRDKRERERDWD